MENLAGVGPGGRDEELGLALADEVGLDLPVTSVLGFWLRRDQVKTQDRNTP